MNDQTSDAAAAAIRRLFGPFVNSPERAELMLDEMACLPPADAYAVFADAWPSCDSTWYLRAKIASRLRAVRFARPGPPVLPADEEWFASLPNLMKVYRGCSSRRARGLSWTRSRRVAEGFARGHRGIRVPSPAIITCRVLKAAVLFATNERQEAEIIVHPDYLPQRIKIERLLS